jgi:hypothetical protein
MKHKQVNAIAIDERERVMVASGGRLEHCFYATKQPDLI